MNIFWAYVRFTDNNSGKKRPVLIIREDKKYYFVLRITSKYEDTSSFFKIQYVEIKDWKKSKLPKPSWVDTYKSYQLPIKSTKLEYIGALSKRDLISVSKHFKF